MDAFKDKEKDTGHKGGIAASLQLGNAAGCDWNWIFGEGRDYLNTNFSHWKAEKRIDKKSTDGRL